MKTKTQPLSLNAGEAFSKEKVAQQRKGGVGLTWRTVLEDFGKGWSLNSLTLPSAPHCPPALPLTTSPLSVRLRKDSLRFRCLLKPLSSSALLGEPGIMLVCKQEKSQGP